MNTAQFLAEKLDTKAKLEIALFFHENPDTIDRPASIATWVGLRPAETSATLNELASAGILLRTGNVYQLTQDEDIRRELVRIAVAFRTARQSVEQQVEQLEAERRRIAAELAELELSLDTIVANMGEGLIVTDIEGTVTFANPAVGRILAVHPESLVGRKIDQAVGIEPLRAAFSRLARPEGSPDLLAGRDPDLEEGRGRRDGGGQDALGSAELAEVREEVEVPGPGSRPRDLSLDIRPIYSDTGEFRGRVCVLTDVTELKELDRLKSDLISFVAHELRSPLTAMKGYAGTLALAGERLDVEQRLHFLESLDREADRLDRLISGFLDLSRIDAGVPIELTKVLFDPVELVREAVEIQLSISDRSPISVESVGPLVHVKADRDKVLQVLLNLLSNAVKYSPSAAADRPISVRVSEASGFVQFEVEDHGFGMTPEQMAGLFTPYYRIRDPEHKAILGTGLGLYLSKHLVEAHGGMIWAESEPDKGSVFYFTIPIGTGQRHDRDTTGTRQERDRNGAGGFPV